MPEPEDTSRPTLTTFTLTDQERNLVARALTMTVALLDALDDSADDIRLLMGVWERVAPETLA